MRIVLLGPPGAGKGTQAELLKNALKLTHISRGDIFREEMKNNTPLGQDIKKYVDSGNLVPDEVVTKIVANKLTTDKKLKDHWLLDGFPRTSKQAEDLDKILEQIKKPLDYIIYMEATLPVIIQRLSGRWVCKACSAVYHILYKPPSKSGVCDACSGPLYQREDDNEETIKKRMEVYLKSTSPIVVYYQAQQKLIKIDADENAGIVHKNLLNIFNKDGKFDHNKVA